MSKESKAVIDQLVHDLENRPNDFSIALHDSLRDQKTHISYDIDHYQYGAGVSSPVDIRFGFIDTIRFNRALKKWKATYVLKLSKELA